MRVPEVLRRLDQWVLPPMGRVAVRLARGGRRLHVVRAAAVVLSVAVVLVAVYAAGRTPAQTDAPSGAIVNLGVRDGDSIPQYVVTSNYRLQQLIADSATVARPPQFFALVSFSTYLKPAQLVPVLAGLDVRVTNVIMRVPSKSQTEIIKIDASAIPSDVARGMTATSMQKAQEVIDYQTLLSKVTGSTPDDLALIASYRSGIAVSQLEEDAYRDLCACVYAAVVYATPAMLGKLAARANVRTVDPAPREQLLDRAVFRPPFPDQHDLAEPPGYSVTAAATAGS
jgi:hypothetical protein